jgi:hypothetical protein
VTLKQAELMVQIANTYGVRAEIICKFKSSLSHSETIAVKLVDTAEYEAGMITGNASTIELLPPMGFRHQRCEEGIILY